MKRISDDEILSPQYQATLIGIADAQLASCEAEARAEKEAMVEFIYDWHILDYDKFYGKWNIKVSIPRTYQQLIMELKQKWLGVK